MIVGNDDPAWLHRRVESISFVDNRVVRRAVSVDFTIPSGLNPVREGVNGGDLFYVPVGALPKLPPLLNLDMVDDCGQSVYLLTTVENAVIDGALLAALAAEASIDTNAKQESIARLASGEPGSRLAAANDLINGAPNTASADRLRFYAFQALENFVLWFPVVGSAGDRKVVKFAYDEFDESTRGFWRRLLRSLSWAPRDKWYSLSQASHSGSYHLAVQAPPLLEVVEAEAAFVQAKDAPPVPVDVQRDGPHVHLYVPRGAARNTPGFLLLKTVASRRGPVTAAWTAALTVAVLLSSMAALACSVAEEVEASIAILVLVPALFAAFVIRPADHLLASEHVGAVRFLTVAVGALPAVASVCVLALHEDPAELRWALVLLAATAWITLLLLLKSRSVASPNLGNRAV